MLRHKASDEVLFPLFPYLLPRRLNPYYQLPPMPIHTKGFSFSIEFGWQLFGSQITALSCCQTLSCNKCIFRNCSNQMGERTVFESFGHAGHGIGSPNGRDWKCFQCQIARFLATINCTAFPCGFVYGFVWKFHVGWRSGCGNCQMDIYDHGYNKRSATNVHVCRG